jgi:hypothetical protein
MVLFEGTVDAIVSIADFDNQFRVPSAQGWRSEYLREWLRHQNCAWLAPTCTSEAVLLKSATPLTVDRFIPTEKMDSIRMLTSRGERRLKNLQPDGLLKNASSLHARYYRSAPATAELLATLARQQ